MGLVFWLVASQTQHGIRSGSLGKSVLASKIKLAFAVLAHLPKLSMCYAYKNDCIIIAFLLAVDSHFWAQILLQKVSKTLDCED